MYGFYSKKGAIIPNADACIAVIYPK
nr:hypothetical protein [uncultured Brachyspira sp.]